MNAFVIALKGALPDTWANGVGEAFGGVLVQRAGGFVEDQYFGALEQGAGDIQGAPTKTVRKNRLGGATTFTDDLKIE